MTYCTVGDLRSHLRIVDTADDVSLSAAVSAACRAIDEWCGRSFEVPTTTSVLTQRSVPDRDNRCLLRLRSGWEIASTTGLVVKTDDDDDGTFETTWTISTDFVLVSPDVRAGAQWPWAELMAVGDRAWPVGGYRERLQVTARFGWPATPEPVRSAALLVAAQRWKLQDAPLGVAGFNEFGPVRVRGMSPMVEELLWPFRAGEAVAGVA